MKVVAESVEIRRLRACIDRVLDHIEQDLGISTVELNDAYYWEVPDSSLHQVDREAPRLDIGNLHDDWEFLRQVADDGDQAVSLMLIHAAPLLRYLAIKVGQ